MNTARDGMAKPKCASPGDKLTIGLWPSDSVISRQRFLGLPRRTNRAAIAPFMGTFIRCLGSPLLRLTEYLGDLVVLTGEVWHSLVRSRIRWGLVAKQLVTIGFGSQLQVIVTGAFTGAVFAAQVYYKFNQLGFESTVGGIVALAMARELGPVLTALMLTSRVGASMAAEIGTMKVTEQVDALRSLGVHPVDYLVAPRFLAMIFSVPLLIGESIRFGMGAA